MAVDRNSLKSLIKDIDELFDALAQTLSLDRELTKWLRDKLMGPALEELRRLTEETRPQC